MNYTYAKVYGNKIFLRTSDRKIQTLTKRNSNFIPEIYSPVPDKQSDITTIDGQYLQKFDSDNVSCLKDAKTLLNGVISDTTPLYCSPNFTYEYIRKFYKGAPPNTKKDIYVLDFDIETGRDKFGYSNAQDASCKITAITMKDSRNDLYRVLSYKDFDAEKYKKHTVLYTLCDDEKTLLLNFVSFWVREYPDATTGWNITGYDIPYIINRIYVLFDRDTADALVDSLSPFGIVNTKILKHFDKESSVYDIVGVEDLDYITLYKKFTYGGRESYKLGHIAFVELGEKKIDYSEVANLQDLYDQKFDKFIRYNVKDVDIVERLDDKLKLIDLVLSLAYKTGTNWTDVISPVKTWDVFIYNTLMDKNIMVRYNFHPSDKVPYVGAYVKEPVPGMYKWVVSFDLNSLYPHIQMGYNISPDKHVSYNDLPADLKSLVDKMPHKTVDKIDALLAKDIDLDILKNHNLCMTANGEFFKRDSDGFIPEMLEGLYSERSQKKRTMLDLKQAIENKSEDEIRAVMGKIVDESTALNEVARLNTLQMALKILMNSEYGALANEYFRHFSLESAEGITSQGQLAIQWAGNDVDDYLNNILGTKNESYVFYMDTDSLYVSFDALVQKYYADLPEDEIVDVLDTICGAKMEPIIDQSYQNLADYTNAYKQKMVMKREVIATTGVWTGKKRYALNVHDSEGVRYAKPKMKIMGMESVRSSTPQLCRDAFSEVMKLILTTDENTVQEYIETFRTEFTHAYVADIAFPRGVNNIEKWMDAGYECKKGTPIHVRSAINFNKFIHDNRIVDYEPIQSGDKLKFIYLEPENTLRTHVIGFPSTIPDKLMVEIDGCIDYTIQYEKAFFTPIKNVLEVVGWQPVFQISLLDFMT